MNLAKSMKLSRQAQRSKSRVEFRFYSGGRGTSCSQMLTMNFPDKEIHSVSIVELVGETRIW